MPFGDRHVHWLGGARCFAAVVLLIVDVGCASVNTALRVETTPPGLQVRSQDETCTAPCELRIEPGTEDPIVVLERPGEPAAVVDVEVARDGVAWLPSAARCGGIVLAAVAGASCCLGLGVATTPVPVVSGFFFAAGASVLIGLCASPWYFDVALTRGVPQRIHVDVDAGTVVTEPPGESRLRRKEPAAPTLPPITAQRY
jgi:hypothetical protein